MRPLQLFSRILIAASVLVLSSISSRGQGIPWYALPLPIPGGFVDASTGNLHLEIPLGSMPQRNGDPIVSKMIYDSANYWYGDSIWSVNGLGWRGIVGSNRTGISGLIPSFQSCASVGVSDPFGKVTTYSGFWFRDIHGTTYALPSDAPYTRQVSCTDSNGQPAGTGFNVPSATGTTPEGVGYTFVVSNYTSWRTYASDGSLVSSNFSDQNIVPRDPNGNTGLSSAPNLTAGLPAFQTYQGNTQGRSCDGVTTTSTFNSTVTASDGSSATYTQTCTVQSVSDGTHVGSIAFMTALGLPDGTSYSFVYDTGASGLHNGTLLTMTLPAGGTVSFTYASGPTQTPAVGTATFAGGTWNLNYATGTPTSTQSTTTVTGPPRYDSASASNLNDKTVFITNYSGGVPYVLTAKYYNGPSTLLKTVNYTYTGATLPTTITTTLNDTGQSYSTFYQYYGNSYRNYPTQKQETDFSGTIIRTTKTTYNSLLKPTSVNVYAGDGSGSPVASTLYTYDEYTANYCKNGVPMLSNFTGAYGHDDSNFGANYTNRGNVTTVQRLISGTTYSTSHMCYDTLGSVTQTVDANGNPTSYDYSENWSDTYCIPSGTITHAFPTTITDALAHRTKKSYFSCPILLQSIANENQIQAGLSTTFTYDFFGRTLSTHSPDGGQQSNTFNPSLPPYQTRSSSITSTSNLTNRTNLDTYGRVVQTQLTSDPSGTTYVDTSYDALGHVATVSNPHRSGSAPTDGVTTSNYDALGRVTRVTKPDGSTINSSYSGPCTTVTDEAWKSRKSCSDALGRLVEADEPTVAGGATPGQGSVTISGSERTVQGPPYSCGYHGQDTCYATIPDTGTVSITVNGFSKSTSYGSSSTSSTLASALASAFNSDSASPVTASASSSVVSLVAKAVGANTNYSLSAASVTSNTQYFSGTSFPVSASGSYLSGGSDASFTNPFVTLYAYDALNNLLTVTQKGGSTDSTQWRARTFNYDSLSRLLCASNPETSSAACPPAANSSYTAGTTGYVYDANGNLSIKTTLAPNQTGTTTVTTSYAYDVLNRLTQKSFSDTTPTVKYGYDAIAPTGCTPPTLTITNGIGRRTSMCDSAGSEAWSYDSMGRPLTDKRTTNAVTKATTYTYNLNSSVATLTNPSGRVITYSYSTASLPISAIDSTGPINYATAATYTPPGGVASLGNGASLVSTIYFNSRLQPCRISVKSSGTAPTSCTDAAIGNILDFTYGFNFGAGDNGNVFAITNNRDTTRSQSFTYDSLNRIAMAQTTSTFATSPSHCWGETYNIDPWSNLQSISATTNSQYTGCTQESGFSKTADGKNHLSGFSYDAPGNTTTDGVNSYVWNAEGQLTLAGGVTYLYDGDGRRVQKSSGKLYWYGIGSDQLDETDLAGNTNNTSFNEYIFFGASRIARRDSANAVNYYFSDYLGSARVVTNANGTILDDSDFYPFGVERPYAFASGNVYKFEKKERDTETGNDDFGARYYSNRFGRWLSADWSSVPVPVPYANPTNPQTLNLYAMVRDDPESFADLDGHRCQDTEHNCTSVVKLTEQNNTSAHTLTVTQTDTTTRTQDDGTKIETVTKTAVTFSTDKANPGGIIDAREFSTGTSIAKDGTRTPLGGSVNPIFGDNISTAEAKNRLGSDATKSYQQKAIVSRAEFFNRAVREDAAKHPIRYAFRGAGLVTPFLELPELAHGVLAGIDILFSGAETVHDVKDIRDGKDQ